MLTSAIVLATFVLAVAACSDSGGTTPDTGVDAPRDALVDNVGPDARRDAAKDAPDATPDGAPDATPDGAPDATPDAAADAGSDTDGAHDSAADVRDAALDAAADGQTDATREASVDSGPGADGAADAFVGDVIPGDGIFPSPPDALPDGLNVGDGPRRGCGAVSFQGCCKGETLFYCDNSGVLAVFSCKSNPKCGWDSLLGIYDCGTSGGADPSSTHPRTCAF